MDDRAEHSVAGLLRSLPARRRGPAATRSGPTGPRGNGIGRLHSIRVAETGHTPQRWEIERIGSRSLLAGGAQDSRMEPQCADHLNRRLHSTTMRRDAGCCAVAQCFERKRPIEVDERTAGVLPTRAAEFGLAVSELVAKRDCRWKAIERGGRTVRHECAVRWLRTRGAAGFHPWPGQ